MGGISFFLFRIGLFVSIAVAFISCTQPLSQNASGDIKIEIPLQTKTGVYELQEVQLQDIHSLRSMRGDYAEFFVSPQIISGSIEGSTFEGRFAKMGDRWVARDVISMTAATIYFHLQQLRKMDLNLGLGQLRAQKQQVALSALILEGSERVYNNAMYEAQSQALLFVPFTGDELPISVNSGILAHEHFHSLFDPLVFQRLKQVGFIARYQSATAHPAQSEQMLSSIFGLALPSDADLFLHQQKPQTPEQEENQLRSAAHALWLKSINEGLADVWGWAYTGDPDFIALSLPSQKDFRTLSAFSTVELPNKGTLRFWAQRISDSKNPTELLNERGYIMGTQWARFFKRYAELLDANKPQKIQPLILNLLQTMTDRLVELDSKDIFNPLNFVMDFSQAQTEQSKEACEWLVRGLNSMKVDSTSPVYQCSKTNNSFQPQVQTDL